MPPRKYLKDRKVLVLGLGVHGGGVASTKWLHAHGAHVTVTDLRTKEQLQPSLKLFTQKQRESITFVLGRHRKSDITHADIIVVSPAIPSTSPYLKFAQDKKKDIQNDTSLFFRFCSAPIIGVTGTRGKTTVTNWVSALLSNTHRSIAPTGNNPENALLKEIRHVRPHQPVVAELSSWQLELLPRSGKAPHIAAITNLYPDHLNRYRNIKAYANAKALIFKDQTQDDFLILNHDSAWCNYFLSKKPRAQLYFVSQQSLPKNRNGIFLENGHVMFQSNGVKKPIVSITTFRENWGAHNVENLLVSILAVLLYDLHVPITQSMIRSLAGVRYRQELVFEDRTARFYNDTTATSPDALISSIERFAGSNTLFIVGGTDKKLPFAHCANVIAQKTDNEHMIFLSGTATTKLLTELKKLRFFKNTEPVVFDSLLQCVAYAYTHTRKNKTSIVFSPGGSSFEKFKNEFHRGELFEKYVRHVTHTSH